MLRYIHKTGGTYTMFGKVRNELFYNNKKWYITLIKNKIKFSSYITYIRKIRGTGAKSYMVKIFVRLLIY
jgi:hypothetical protein